MQILKENGGLKKNVNRKNWRGCHVFSSWPRDHQSNLNKRLVIYVQEKSSVYEQGQCNFLAR